MFQKEQQTKFLEEIQTKSGLPTKEIASFIQISSRSYRDWKNEKSCIPLRSALLLSKTYRVPLPEDSNVMLRRWKEFKLETYRKGALARFEKHGELATIEGRAKGGRNALKIMRESGVIPKAKVFNYPEHNMELAEFVGILLGDGGITHSQVQITLNSVADRHYLPFVLELSNNLFGERPKYFHDKNSNAVKIYLTGVNLVKFLVCIGLKTGNKVKQQVDVPEWVKQDIHYSIACTRGLMDTDGGVFLHKYKVNSKQYSYRKICFTNKSKPILDFVYITLERLKLGPKYGWDKDNKRVWIYNSHKTERYLDIIGSHNPRLYSWRISRTVQGMVC